MAPPGGNKRKIHTPSFWGLFLILFAFWLLITGSVHYHYLLGGALCAYLVARFNNSLLILPQERFAVNFKTAMKAVFYLGNLIAAVFMSGIDVARIVLQREMPISPCIVKFTTSLDKTVSRVILANSITLTPGTLTIGLEGDSLTVHCLTRENALEVSNWYLEKEL
ncbi:MAG TPA: Na+/H+ antiporter subunit E, partial [Firmicutes bacterium]|nr:Na+/H+ antiporter subunit E [Bacillota bacterium]